MALPNMNKLGPHITKVINEGYIATGAIVTFDLVDPTDQSIYHQAVVNFTKVRQSSSSSDGTTGSRTYRTYDDGNIWGLVSSDYRTWKTHTFGDTTGEAGT